MNIRFFLAGLMSVLGAAWGCALAQNVYVVTPDGGLTVRQAVEKARADSGAVTIYLRGGTYRLDRPLLLTPRDGGVSKSLLIRNYPGERAVLSSGLLLDLKWERHKGKIMKARVEGDPVMDMLVVGGSLRPMARYPNYDPKAVRFNGTSADATSPRRVKRWKHPEGGYLNAMHRHDWGDFHYRITGKEAGGKLRLEGGWQNNRPYGLHPDNRMVENIFEELDAPGEWFYDSRTHYLYYYPMPGERVEELDFQSPQLKNLVELAGTPGCPVRNVTLQGLGLTQTVRTFMESYEPLLRSDWTIYRGGAVLFRNTEGCALRDCDLYLLGGNGVFFDCYNRRSEVAGSHLYQIGASAICFVGDTAAVRSPSFKYEDFVPLAEMDQTKGPRSDNYPAFCRVYDNLIHHIGLYEKQVSGVELSMCRDITVSHNSIYDTPRSAVNISEGTWGGHVIENNDLFNTVKETGDHGSINAWGRDRFWHPDYGTMTRIAEERPALLLADALEPVVIRGNRVRCDRGWDIDLDDGASNYQIYNNLCLNGGIKLREGFYRTVENNVIVNNTLHPHLWFKRSGDVFTRNIVMGAYKPISVNGWGLMVDYNVFADSVSYRAALQQGGDVHSIVADIRFLNAPQGNFNVADDSDAITKGGFRNFPMDRFGVCSPRLRKLADAPSMPVPVVRHSEAGGSTFLWKGALLKNLNTLEERSATGMDAERGVYVISVDALDSPLRDFLAPNDVILGIDGKPVGNLDDFEKAVKSCDSVKKLELVIFRMQRECKVTVSF